MTERMRRAAGWLRGRVRVIAEWPCRKELAELRDQRRKFTAVLDAVEDSVVLTEPDGRLRFANRLAARVLERLSGRALDELYGKRPSEMGLPDDLVRTFATEREQLNATRSAVTTELAIPQADGSRRWYEAKACPVVVDGAVRALVMIGRDIDERKRAQRRLELLSKLSQLAGKASCEDLLPAVARVAIPELADWSAVDTRADDRVVRSYVAARDPARAELAAALQRFRPWKQPRAWAELAAGRSLFFPEVSDALLRANSEDDEHLALVRQMGIRSAIAVPLRVRGQTVAVLSFATAESRRRFTAVDRALAEELAGRAAIVLERARLLAELSASERRFRVALAASRTAVFEQDRQLRYLWHYNGALRVNAIGKTHADIFPPHEAEELTAIKRRVLDTGEPVRAEVRLTMSDGGRYDVALSIDPVRDERGAVVGLIGAGIDVTDDKRVQEELAQAVTFREELMGIVGHDLRNPLTAVAVAAGRLKQRADLLPDARAHVERIDRAARRMTELIRTILDVTQVRFHGGLPVSPRPTDLAEVARAIVDELRAANPDRVIALAVDGDARGVWDAARIAEVLANLVGNALEHGGADEPVSVRVDGGGDEVRLYVHNGGPPIAPELTPALFDPFRRGGARSGGLGLGLYIVRQIVLAHGGDIDVESRPGDGTTFVVRLPRGLAAAA